MAWGRLLFEVQVLWLTDPATIKEMAVLLGGPVDVDGTLEVTRIETLVRTPKAHTRKRLKPLLPETLDPPKP